LSHPKADPPTCGICQRHIRFASTAPKILLVPLSPSVERTRSSIPPPTRINVSRFVVRSDLAYLHTECLACVCGCPGFIRLLTTVMIWLRSSSPQSDRFLSDPFMFSKVLGNSPVTHAPDKLLPRESSRPPRASNQGSLSGISDVAFFAYPSPLRSALSLF